MIECCGSLCEGIEGKIRIPIAFNSFNRSFYNELETGTGKKFHIPYSLQKVPKGLSVATALHYAAHLYGNQATLSLRIQWRDQR